jgi:N-acetylmuramoyl-L-alanine amidase
MRKRIARVLFLLMWVVVGSSCASTPKASREAGAADLEGYVSLASVCDRWKINYSWDPVTERHILAKGESFASFRTDDYLVSLNGKLRSLSSPPRRVKGELQIPQELANLPWWKDEAWWREIASDYWPGGGRVEKVVIDAGHGGKDQGAVGFFGMEEKGVNLHIAKKVQERLRAAGIKTVMTRDDDRFLTLSERTWIGNNSGADLFVSIHANSSPQSDIQGVEIYHLSEKMKDRMAGVPITTAVFPTAEDFEPAGMDPQEIPAGWTAAIDPKTRRRSVELARAIESAFQRNGSIEKRGVKEAAFFVLRWTVKPAVLVEVGFLTHRREATKLSDSDYQDEVAARIVEGIMLYKAQYESTRGFAAS